jgi:ubiquinone/menaquinone biosynthesis C-methylase UbiE
MATTPASTETRDATPARAGGPSGPDRLLALGNGFWASQILAAAAEHRFFTLIASGRRTADAIAASAGTDPRGTRMVLDSLTALDVLVKSDAGYALTPDAEAFLVEGRPGDLTPMLVTHTRLVWDRWSHLGEALRDPDQVRQYIDLDSGREFFPKLVRAILPLGLGAADALAEHLGVGGTLRGVQVLDVGVGAAAWSMPFARRDDRSTITGFDLPEVLHETAAVVREAGLSDRYRLVAGNLLEADFGANAYDIVILGNMCHGLIPAQNRDLLARTHRALVPGGRLLIADMIPNEDRSGPVFPVLFAVNMFVMGGEDTYPLSDYRAWLAHSGFRDVTTHDTKRSHSPVIVATK